MAEGLVQRRGVPQAEALADRFGQQSLGAPTELPPLILPIAKVARVDLPCMGEGLMVALAANRSMVQLLNPAGSNTDLLVKRIWASAPANANIQVKTHDTALATLLTSLAALVRQEGTSQVAPIGQVRRTQGAAVGTTFALITVVSGVTESLNFDVGDGEEFDGIVLQPGRGILCDPGSDNVQMIATFHWLERQTG